MEELFIAPSPPWYHSSGVACSPDNTFVYFHKNEIIIFSETGPDVPPKIDVIYNAHSKQYVHIYALN